jgi:uncharacterized protein (TIGR02145 family)
MPDGRTWFAQNLNYTKDLTFNAYAREANGKQFIPNDNGIPAIGSYWCPGVSGSTYSGDQNTCNVYGALYTWETAMMVDGKYADETKTSTAWDESWVSSYYFSSGAIGTTPNADKNNARGGSNVKGGGRGICPMGWHIPTMREWAYMLDKVDGNGSGQTLSDAANSGWHGTDVCSKLKTKIAGGDIYSSDGSWNLGANTSTDQYGFSLTPSGNRNPDLQLHGRCYGIELMTSTPNDENRLSYVQCEWNNDRVLWMRGNRPFGISVRCLKD